VSLLLGVLEALGVGGQVLVAAVLFAAAIYAYKGAAVARLAALQAASGLWYVVVLAVALAAAILAGWIDPNPSAFLAFVESAVSTGASLLGDLLSRVSIR